MKMKGLMKKILLLLAVVLSFGTVMAWDFIRVDLSIGDGAGVGSSFNYVRIVSSTTHDAIVSDLQAENGLGSDYRFTLNSKQVQAITDARDSNANAQFYFEFYYLADNVANTVWYSDYVTASELASSISSILGSNGFLYQGTTLSLTGYAVPEPTSGLLLLVGGALLGLRRKRRVA